MPRTPADESTSSGTVARVALLLRVLAESGGDTPLGEIAQRMKLPASTTHRLLNLLLEQGFVDRGIGNTYRPGLEFLRVGGLVAARAELTEVAHGFMQAVVDACDETCVLSVYMPRNRSAMIAKVIYGSHPLRYEATLYEPSSLVWGATGKGILAFLPADVAEDIVAHEGPSPGDGRTVNRAQLQRDLEQVRRQGYAHTRGQKIQGAVGLSAPVFNASGVVAALCITVPDTRFEDAMAGRFSTLLKAQALRFSNALGWRGTPAA